MTCGSASTSRTHPSSSGPPRPKNGPTFSPAAYPSRLMNRSAISSAMPDLDLLAGVTDGLDIIAVRVTDKRRVVARMVFRPQAGLVQDQFCAGGYCIREMIDHRIHPRVRAIRAVAPTRDKRAPARAGAFRPANRLRSNG